MTYRAQLWMDIEAFQESEVEAVIELKTARLTRSEGLPEGKDYVDDGCHVAPHCLSCPLAVCIHDSPVRSQNVTKRLDEINSLLSEGLSVRAVALRLSVSARTIHRIRRATTNGN